MHRRPAPPPHSTHLNFDAANHDEYSRRYKRAEETTILNLDCSQHAHNDDHLRLNRQNIKYIPSIDVSQPFQQHVSGDLMMPPLFSKSVVGCASSEGWLFGKSAVGCCASSEGRLFGKSAGKSAVGCTRSDVKSVVGCAYTETPGFTTT